MALTTTYGTAGIGRYGFNSRITREHLSTKQRQILAAQRKKKREQAKKRFSKEGRR